tara:strand:+ start:2319 stop:2579 length:261 start_codon:yes stop_codon:yes gene_type:complete
MEEFMSKFNVIEVPFEPMDIKPTLEDEFTMISVSRELESIKDPKKLKMAALNLLMITMQRQAIIRGLCKRLAKVETDDVIKTTHKG